MISTIENNMLTTGKAASVCGVTPDTVLKWIKSGKLKGTRTAGGHYRISQKNLACFAPSATPSLPRHNVDSLPVPCWEFNAKNGIINGRCLKCAVYTLKSEKCYVIAALGKRAGHQGLFCETSCEKCRYFSHVHGAIKVLIVSRSWERYKICKTSGRCRVDIRFACCGYEVSTIVAEFKPDAVLFDDSIAEAELRELIAHLKKDSRILKHRILFIANGPLDPDKVPREIDAILKPPFSIPELKRGFFSSKAAKR